MSNEKSETGHGEGDPKDEAEAPAVRCGIVLYQLTNGHYGVADMADRGGAQEKISLAQKAAILGAATSMNNAELTAEYSIRLQADLIKQARADKTGLIGPDGVPL